jgi:hypothetical protein
MRFNTIPLAAFPGWARLSIVAFAALLVFVFSSSDPASARSRRPAKEKPAEEEQTDTKSDAKSGKNKDTKGQKDAAKPEQLGTFGDWSAFATRGSGRTCYALASPKERQPKAKLKDTSAYVFISSRPGEGVKNEVAINLGYATKDNSNASADVDGDGFELVTKGTNAWVKNPAKEKEFVETLKSGSKLIVKASSNKGTTTTDSYSLKGLSETLARVQQECK